MSASGPKSVEDALYQQARYISVVIELSLPFLINAHPCSAERCRERTSRNLWSASERFFSPVSEVQAVSHCFASSTFSQPPPNITESMSIDPIQPAIYIVHQEMISASGLIHNISMRPI